jgi:hypothetical protein
VNEPGERESMTMAFQAKPYQAREVRQRPREMALGQKKTGGDGSQDYEH